MEKKEDAPSAHVEGEAPSVKDLKVSVNDEDGNMLYASIMENHRPDKFGWGYLRLYLICGLVFLCSTMNGKLSLLLDGQRCSCKLRLRRFSDVFD